MQELIDVINAFAPILTAAKAMRMTAEEYLIDCMVHGRAPDGVDDPWDNLEDCIAMPEGMSWLPTEEQWEAASILIQMEDPTQRPTGYLRHGRIWTGRFGDKCIGAVWMKGCVVEFENFQVVENNLVQKPLLMICEAHSVDLLTRQRMATAPWKEWHFDAQDICWREVE